MFQKSILLAVAVFAGQAFSAEVYWHKKQTKVICGATVDNQTLDVKVSVANEVLKAESPDGRVLIFIDLHKEGQVRWVFSEVINDADYERREALMAKLSSEEADLLKSFTKARMFDLYAGFSEGYVHLRQDFGSKNISLSCKETAQITLD